MENILQNLFTESLKYLEKKDFEQSKKIMYQIIEKIKPEDLKKNSFILFNLGMCEMNMNNIGEAVNAFVSIYEYYQTDKSLSICYIPHLEKIFNDPNNYENGFFKYYSKRYDNVDLIYSLINSYFVSDYNPNTEFIDKINDNIKDEIMRCYFSHIYKIVFNEPNFDQDKLIQTISDNMDRVIQLTKEKQRSYNIYDFTIFIYTNYFYYLCYLDTNIVELQKKYSTILRNILPDINYISPHVETIFKNKLSLPYTKKRIKLGFFSYFMADLSSVLRDRANIIKSLPKDIFEVHLICYGPPKAEFLQIGLIKSLYDLVEHKHYLSQITSIDRSIDKKIVKYLSDLELDILVYSDIGMTIESVIFAHMRLAPVQINTWGHSVTSGISTVDYYFSSDLYEIDRAQENYSEKLIKMKSMCTCYPTISIQMEKNDYEELGIPKDKFIVSCLQMRHKFKPEFLNMINRIINNHPDILLIMLDNNNIKEYFKLFIDNIDRIKFIPKCTFNLFNKYINYSHLILDTFPFGGCNSSLEGFTFNKVVVTKPTNYLSGRFTYGFYKRMNIFEPIAYDNDEYYDLVSEFITNHEYRKMVENKISIKKKLLFEDSASINEWVTTLIDVSRPFVKIDHPNIKYN